MLLDSAAAPCERKGHCERKERQESLLETFDGVGGVTSPCSCSVKPKRPGNSFSLQLPEGTQL